MLRHKVNPRLLSVLEMQVYGLFKYLQMMICPYQYKYHKICHTEESLLPTRVIGKGYQKAQRKEKNASHPVVRKEK